MKPTTLMSHERALELSLIQIQRLKREEGYASAKLDDGNLLASREASLAWNATKKEIDKAWERVERLRRRNAISDLTARNVNRVFEQAIRRAFKESNATLDPNHHPLVKELREEFWWERVRQYIGFMPKNETELHESQ